MDSPRPVPPEARSRASSVRWKRSNTRSRSSAGMPGPSSSTTNRMRSAPGCCDSQDYEPSLGGGVLDRIGEQVAQRLGEPVRVGEQRAGRSCIELEATAGEERGGLPELTRRKPADRFARRAGTRPARLVASRSRSSTRRLIRAISPCTRRSTRRSSSRGGFSWAESTSSCPRITVSGVRSSCEASATNAR